MHEHEEHHHEGEHTHSLEELTYDEARDHLVRDARVLSAVGGVAAASEVANMSMLKTAFSLGGEDAWWVVMTARKAWSAAEGNKFSKLAASLKASKMSLAALAGVAFVATPLVEQTINQASDLTATTAFCGAAVAISTTSMVEDMWNDRSSGHQATDYERLSRRFRSEGILATFVFGYMGFRYIGDGNPFVMAAVGGTDCIWTAARSFNFVRRSETAVNETITE